MNRGKKISDEQFLSILRENAGLYAKTAQVIREQFKISYSRQAVRERAEYFKDELNDIIEENLDIAEDGLMTLMKSKNEHIKMRAIEFFLKNRARTRGYNERMEITGANGAPLVPIQIEIINKAEQVREDDPGS